MALKIDYDTVKLQKVTFDVTFLWRHKDYVTENTSSKWRHKNFPFSSSSLSKTVVALLTWLHCIYRYSCWFCKTEDHYNSSTWRNDHFKE